jgi:two-component system LytT family response regulator
VTVKLRTLIVDDEPLARQRLRRLCDEDPDIEIVGECNDGQQAVDSLREHRPDLVFLDVQMPALDGFATLQSLGDSALPMVIFVTAHDRYALKAFEVHALDYLLKPFDRSRFAAALEHAKAQFRQGHTDSVSERLSQLLQAFPDRSRYSERLMVKSGGRIYFVAADTISWLEAAGNYVRLHVGKEDHLLRETLTSLEKKLDPKRFVRIHRSAIVNLACLRELQPAFHGDYVVILQDGTELALSRGCRDKLEEALGHAL